MAMTCIHANDKSMAAPLQNFPLLDAPNEDVHAGSKYDFPRDLRGYGRHPPPADWPNNAKIAISFVINYEEGAERTVMNGDGESESNLWEQTNRPGRIGERALNAESDYEYGSRVGIWRLLNMFEKHNVPVTCFAVGQALEMNPEVVTALKDGGHEIASHGYRWLDYHSTAPELERAYIARQLECLKGLTGDNAFGWYYGRLSPRSLALVHEVYEEQKVELLWESDCYNDDLPYWIDVPAEKNADSPKGMLMLPYSYDCNDLKFHSPTGAFSPNQFFEYLQGAFDTLYQEGKDGTPKMMTVGLHCRIIGKPGRAVALQRFLQYISSMPSQDVWVTTRGAIAKHWRQKYPYKTDKS